MCRLGANFGWLARPPQNVHSKGGTTLQVGLTLYADLTANRQPSRRPVFFSELVD